MARRTVAPNPASPVLAVKGPFWHRVRRILACVDRAKDSFEQRLDENRSKTYAVENQVYDGLPCLEIRVSRSCGRDPSGSARMLGTHTRSHGFA